MKHKVQTLLVMLAAFLGATLVTTGQVNIPYTFTANTTIRSAEVNSNFSTLGSNALNRTGGNLTGNITADSGITVDGVDIGARIPSSSTLNLNGLTYTFPASQTANSFLQTNGSGTLSWAASTSLNTVVDGRLTATSATPVTTSNVAAATSIYYTPYKGNRIALYDGSALWNTRTFTEITISISGCTASKPYDVFMYDNAGTVTAETLVWTSATARATALTTQDGVLVKTGATTRRYVGSFYCNSSGGQTDDTLSKRLLWNYYNRVPRPMRLLEATATWNYTLATWRQANGSTSNQLDVMVGWAEVPLDANVLAISSNSTAGVNRFVAIGEDSTTSPLAGQLHGGLDTSTMAAAINVPFAHNVAVRTYPAVGRHFYTWMEISSATGTSTWYGAPIGTDDIQCGMFGEIQG